jgi:hypothetical protein
MPTRLSFARHYLLTGLIVGCATSRTVGAPPVNDTSLYFESPAQAVEISTQLLRAEQFEQLSRYYDLRDTQIDRAQLASGDFFVRRERPATAHPGGFWRFKEPFAPGFEYADHALAGEVATVRVTVEIDQGDGMMQRGESFFRLRKSAHGWQLLPGPGEPPSAATEAPEPLPPPHWER